jgi:hypothetical protein
MIECRNILGSKKGSNIQEGVITGREKRQQKQIRIRSEGN